MGKDNVIQFPGTKKSDPEGLAGEVEWKAELQREIKEHGLEEVLERIRGAEDDEALLNLLAVYNHGFTNGRQFEQGLKKSDD